MKIKIRDDVTPHQTPNSNSNCHYGYHSGGKTYDRAYALAEDIALDLRKSSSNRNIELAILPYPGKEGFFYVEQRYL